MTWLPLTFISITCASFASIVAKKVLSYPKLDSFIFAGLFQLLVGIIALPLALISR